MRGGGSCSSGDRGPGHWLCTGWMLWTCVAQPWEGTGTRVSGVHSQDCAGVDRAQVPTAGSHPRFKALPRNARLQIPTMSSKKRSMFSLVCALGTPREQQSTLWAAYLGGCRDDKPPLPAVSLVQPAGPLPCSATCLGKWLGSLGSRIKLGGNACQGWGSLCPYPPIQPQTITLKCYL